MSKRKTTTSQNQSWTATHAWDAPPINAQTQAVIDMSNEAPRVDPSTQQRYATMEEDVRRSYQDPFGAATSPDVRQKAQTSKLLEVGAERDKAMREGYYQGQQATFGRKLAAAGLTMPTLVQTGGTNQGTATTRQGTNLWGSLTGKG